MSTDDRSAALGRLCAAVTQLGDDEVRVLAEIARRLLFGQGVYGRLTLASDPRDMQREASEELLDGCVYLACASLRAAPPTLDNDETHSPVNTTKR